jgi:hypothetical protein
MRELGPYGGYKSHPVPQGRLFLVSDISKRVLV